MLIHHRNECPQTVQPPQVAVTHPDLPGGRLFRQAQPAQAAQLLAHHLGQHGDADALAAYASLHVALLDASSGRALGKRLFSHAMSGNWPVEVSCVMSRKPAPSPSTGSGEAVATWTLYGRRTSLRCTTSSS